VHLGVANRAFVVFQQDSDLPRGDVEPAQTPFCPIELLIFVMGVVAEVFVPMSASAGLPAGKDNLLNAALF
jgi:hypothetical protein